MKLAFCLFKYFPFGGLQRDFLRIARICRDRGHEVHVFTQSWEGESEPDFTLHLLKPRGWQNHTRSQDFAKLVKQKLKLAKYDLVIGFNKMPFLDLYYAADVCYQARALAKHSFYYRFLPRYQQWKTLEQAVFAVGHKTEIMLISKQQLPEYQSHYQTEAERFHLLPPGIAKDRIAPENAADIRASLRKAYQIAEHQFLLLMVGSGFKTKGLDRALFALSALPSALKARCQLFVIGQDNPQTFLKLAKKLGIKEQVHFLGGRNDVPQFLLGGDVLLHPAYHENTGTVLLEAVVSGLPVLTTDVCGYASYVAEAQVGIVLKSPFKQVEFNQALEKMLLSTDQGEFKQNGLAYAKRADIYSLPEKAANLIDHIGQRKRELISA